MRLAVDRRLVLVTAVVALALAAGLWLVVRPSTGSEETIRPTVSPAGLRAIPPGGRLLVRAVDLGAPNSEGLVYELTRSGMQPADLRCTRVHVSAAGPGICMDESLDRAYYQLDVFGTDEAGASAPVIGIPSRARVSADGRYGAYTAFMDGGDGYVADPTQFDTNTRIVDMADGSDLLNLDDLEITHAGRLIEGPDRELWGVTFGDGGAYYATVADGQDRLLIEGRVVSDHARVVRDGMECPSLSPDRTRIAYKRPLADGETWRLHVLDLDTGRDVALSERRSIDDQPEWLGDDQIVYSDSTAVYAVPADGTGRPIRIAGQATSPAYAAGTQEP